MYVCMCVFLYVLVFCTFILVVCLDISVLSNLDHVNVRVLVIHDRFLCNSYFTHCKIIMLYSFYNKTFLYFLCKIMSIEPG